METPLLKTKLYIPTPRPELVPRPRLIERLERGARTTRLTLLSAPAGFGKTTLLAEWIHGRGAACGEATNHLAPTLGKSGKTAGAASVPLRFAWLSLDARDDEPARFWSYFFGALQTVRPGLGQEVLDALGGSAVREPETRGLDVTRVEQLLARTVNEIADLSQPVVLILDDLHLVQSPRVHEGIVFLLEHSPPSPGGVHLVLSSRADPPWPLARLRTRGELTELRARDLRFTPQEAEAFLNDVAGLGLSAEDLTTLEARTEGWIAGLQLAALAMQAALAAQGALDRQGPLELSSFVRAFGGSNRLVLDYLVEEVLERQPPEVQAFLLQTSILDRMSAPLCDALFSDAGADSAAILERLERDNLFVVPLDDERRWYRYHHLFADLLRRRLQTDPGREQALHRAASAWFERQGWIAEAIPHAIASQDHEHAVALIETLAPEILAGGDFGRMRVWLDALPETRIRSSAPLSILRAWTTHRISTSESLEKWLRQAETLAVELEQNDPDTASTVRSNAAFLRVMDARSRNAPVETQLALLRQAERIIPERDQALRCSIATWRGLCHMDRVEESAAEDAFVEAWRIGLVGKGHWTAIVSVYLRTVVARWRGRLHHAASVCREALAATRSAAEGVLAYRSDLYVPLGRILLEWNDLQAAQACLSKGLDRRTPSLNEFAVKGGFARARLEVALGQPGAVPDLRGLTRNATGGLAVYAGTLEAWLCLLSATRAPDDPRAAHWRQRAAEWAADRALTPHSEDWQIIEQLVKARVRIAGRRGRDFASRPVDLRPVLEFLDAQAALLQERDWVELLVQTQIVKSLALQALGRQADALAALETALEEAEPGGYRRVFLDEGAPMARLLRLSAERGVARAKPFLCFPPVQTTEGTEGEPLDPLSARELDVLRLMATTLTTPQMAEELVVSVNTVRTHVQHIYQKLDAHSRYEAVTRAREFGLL